MTEVAVEGLNGMEVGNRNLKVQRASIGITQASGLEMGVNAMSMLAGTTSDNLEEGRVLQLLNMVTPEELIDNDDYEGMHLNPACEKSTDRQRNMRRHQRRMRQIRLSPEHESSSPKWRKQTIQWGWKDIHQIRFTRICAQGIAGSSWAKICRQNSGDHVFSRGQSCLFLQITPQATDGFPRSLMKSMLGECNS